MLNFQKILKKNNMLNGFDDIDYLLEMKDSIIEFSKNSPI
jgi:3-isopropylmalate/(R)-2-methylmalate dehydratase small subunit